jgi:hypothetical protein
MGGLFHSQGVHQMEEFVFRSLLSTIAPNAAASSEKIAFTASKRYGITIQAYASPVYVKAVTKGGTDPAPSSTDYFWPIPANSMLWIKIADNFDVYVISAGNYSAQEWG